MDAVEKTAHLTLSEGCKSIPWFPVQLLTVTFEQTASGRYVDVLLPESMFNLVDYHLRECLKQIHGGLSHVNVLGSMFFAGISGSATAERQRSGTSGNRYAGKGRLSPAIMPPR